MTEHKSFIKKDNQLFFNEVNFEEYELENGKVYDLKYNHRAGSTEFYINGDLNMPKKLYETSRDKVFKKRVMKYFESPNVKNLGILLSGEKGTGKTVMAKSLALKSGLPIIVVDSDYPTSRLTDFFKKIKVPTCVIFDEIEKNFNTTNMLGFLDGVEEMPKKLVLMTCNDDDDIDENLINRCSRVRYYRKYTLEDNLEFLPMLVDDFEIKNKEEVITFCKEHITFMSMDNLCSFLTEVKLWEDDEDISLEDIIKYMNISSEFTDIPARTGNVSSDDSHDDDPW